MSFFVYVGRGVTANTSHTRYFATPTEHSGYDNPCQIQLSYGYYFYEYSPCELLLYLLGCNTVLHTLDFPPIP